MTETLEQNDQVDISSIVDQSLNSEFFEFKRTLLETTRDKIERKPDTPDGKKVFNYTDKTGQKWEIVAWKKENNTYTIRVKKRVYFPELWRYGWKAQKDWENKEFLVTAKDSKTFSKWFEWILNNTIWSKNKCNLKNTWKKIYEDLDKTSPINSQTPKQTTNPKTPEQKTRSQSHPIESIESNEKMPEWLRIENGVYIYRVQPNDTRIWIFNKLKKYSPLSYLNDWYSWYSQGANWFNLSESYLPSNKFDKWVDLIVPNREYTKNVYEFRDAQLTAIENMKNNTKYWDKIKKLFMSTKQWWYWYTEKQVADVMTAFARSESSIEKWSENIWECALFRYEPSSQVFSYWYHHIVLSLKDWKVQKSDITWDKALKWLGFNIWDTCNPIRSGMLFLAYCLERKPDDYRKFFDIENNLDWCCKSYNWAHWKSYNPRYDIKLKNNYEKIKALT